MRANSSGDRPLPFSEDDEKGLGVRFINGARRFIGYKHGLASFGVDVTGNLEMLRELEEQAA